uniref:Uncharacterized protein n=1 Tax=Rhizophora mucronata TaxID=61149 RepID=A0A2P2NIE0_RHIMU
MESPSQKRKNLTKYGCATCNLFIFVHTTILAMSNKKTIKYTSDTKQRNQTQ